MEKDLKFSSAVCTSRVQSERLLALGLKKETGDMCWMYGKKYCHAIPPSLMWTSLLGVWEDFGNSIGQTRL